jgi:predicted regulator of Ras-like GTPase activity (Roadblock/LC7/MglB family)
MAFSDQLSTIVTSVDGAIAVSIMGFDGIAIETKQVPALEQTATALELQNAWVEFGNVLGQLKQAAQTLKTGPIAELSVNTEKLVTLMRLVTPEYFVVLALTPAGNYGKGRYALRIAAPQLAKELV